MRYTRSVAACAGALAASIVVAACGGGAAPSSSAPSSTSRAPVGSSTSRTATTKPAPVARPVAKPPPPSYPRLLAAGLGSGTTGTVPVVAWQGRPAVWLSRSASGIALMSFDQSQVQLRLHSGTIDAGTIGWRFGPSVVGTERRHLVAAFNGGFKLSVGAGGFMSYGRLGAPLQGGVGSIVTYADGTTDIGSWRQEVPAPGHAVVSVRQNLPLLIDHGQVAGTVGCLSCWGATLGGVSDPARSALGIQPNGHLVWAGVEHATVSDLADALLGAGVVRAVELDINPEWVAGYLYGHRGGAGPVAPVPVVAGQTGIPGQFLVPWSRDFFAIEAR